MDQIYDILNSGNLELLQEMTFGKDNIDTKSMKTPDIFLPKDMDQNQGINTERRLIENPEDMDFNKIILEGISPNSQNNSINYNLLPAEPISLRPIQTTQEMELDSFLAPKRNTIQGNTNPGVSDIESARNTNTFLNITNNTIVENSNNTPSDNPKNQMPSVKENFFESLSDNLNFGTKQPQDTRITEQTQNMGAVLSGLTQNAQENSRLSEVITKIYDLKTTNEVQMGQNTIRESTISSEFINMSPSILSSLSLIQSVANPILNETQALTKGIDQNRPPADNLSVNGVVGLNQMNVPITNTSEILKMISSAEIPPINETLGINPMSFPVTNTTEVFKMLSTFNDNKAFNSNIVSERTTDLDRVMMYNLTSPEIQQSNQVVNPTPGNFFQSSEKNMNLPIQIQNMESLQNPPPSTVQLETSGIEKLRPTFFESLNTQGMISNQETPPTSVETTPPTGPKPDNSPIGSDMNPQNTPPMNSVNMPTSVSGETNTNSSEIFAGGISALSQQMGLLISVVGGISNKLNYLDENTGLSFK
jgi:hypothetical protein